MDNIEDIFIGRLISHGVDHDAIPGFVKSLSNFLAADPDMSLLQVNQRLNYLGWIDVQLDYQTLQLGIACLEAGGGNGDWDRFSNRFDDSRDIDAGPNGVPAI